MFRHTFCGSDRLFLIAEIGGNHEGNFEYAKKLLSLAVEGGADAVKFQIYRGDKIVSKQECSERNKHFKKFELTFEQYKELAMLAREMGTQFMSSLWDREAVEEFDPYISVHKIGSGDITNYRLLKELALKNKPLLVATAMSKMEEVRDSVAFIDSVNPSLRREGKLCLMQCVAMYGDIRPAYAHLGAIRALQDEFPDIHIGYSDHTKGKYASEISLALGARVIEVHFTDDKSREFRDHELSLTNEELISLRSKAEEISVLLGPYAKSPVSDVETPERIQQFRRAIYLKEDQPAGTLLTSEILTTLRPNKGLDARMYFDVIGRTLAKDKAAFEAFSEEDLK